MKDIKNKLFANMNVNVNTNTKNITTPPQQVHVNKHHVDKQRINNQRGFTIIEVALVLAIAGLIFLVVFLALPALQNSQKDTARKQDVARVVSALQQYAADHNGDLSSLGSHDGNTYSTDGTNSSDISGYIGKLSQATRVWIWSSDNSSAWYNGWLIPGHPGGGHPTVGVIIGYTCAELNAGSTSSVSPSTSDAAVWAVLSNNKNYCADM